MIVEWKKHAHNRADECEKKINKSIDSTPKLSILIDSIACIAIV